MFLFILIERSYISLKFTQRPECQRCILTCCNGISFLYIWCNHSVGISPAIYERTKYYSDLTGSIYTHVHVDILAQIQ